jgi:hypothetical protein
MKIIAIINLYQLQMSDVLIVLVMCRRCLNHSTKFWEKCEKLITFNKVVQSQNYNHKFIYWRPSNNSTSMFRIWLFVFFFNLIKYFGYNTFWKLLLVMTPFENDNLKSYLVIAKHRKFFIRNRGNKICRKATRVRFFQGSFLTIIAI